MQCSGNFCWSINTLTFFPFLFERNMKIVLLGSFNDCIVWTPSQRTLQLHIKLWQLIIWVTVTKNRCVTHVKIRGYANLVSSLLAYLISAVASWFSNSILSRFRMLLQIACYYNVTLFSTAGKF